MAWKAIAGAAAAAALLLPWAPAQATDDSTALPIAATTDQPLEEYADQHHCVLADQLVIEFDDGTSHVYEPECMTESEANAAKSAGLAPAATTHPVFWFTSGRPSVKRTTTRGAFGAQRTMTKGYPVAMSYQIAPSFRSIAITPAVVVFTRSRQNCRYAKTRPASYFFHWSCRDHRLQKVYTETGSLIFGVRVDGVVGTARIGVTFRYAHALV